MCISGTSITAAILGVSSVLAPAALSAGADHPPAPEIWPDQRCATGYLLQAIREASSSAALSAGVQQPLIPRPVLAHSYDSPAGFLKLHYDLSGQSAVPTADLDNSGTADYIERLALAGDSAWLTQVGHLGYLSPPTDEGRGGDERYDIYFQDIAAFGFTQSETVGPAAWNDYSSFIVCHNDFQGFPPNDDPEGNALGSAKATLAHEIHHAIQFAYDRDDEFWYMEASATWMEEIVFDESNDNYNLMPGFFAFPEIALNSNLLASGHLYGTFVWPLFLSERFDTTLMRQIWEGARFSSVTGTLADSLPAVFGVTMDEAFSEFINWMYLTGSRDDGAHFSEGAAYPEVNVPVSVSVYPVTNSLGGRSPAGYASSAVRFSAGGAVGDLKVSFDGFNGRTWAALLITSGQLIGNDIHWLTLDHDRRGSVTIRNFETYDDLTLIGVNLSLNTGSAPFRYAAEIVGASGVAVVPAGDSISFTLSDNPVGLTLVNLASTSDSFTVSVSESAGWEVVTPSGAVTLPPGADTTVVATVRPPAGTLPGAFSVIRLRAGSVTDPAVSDSVAIRQIVSVSHQDPNWDGSTNIADVTHLISWLFSAGPDPTPDFSSGDPDCNGRINIADVAFIIGYLFAGGAGPPCQPADPLNP